MQLSFKSQRVRTTRKTSPASTLLELEKGEHGILDRIDLPREEARRLMELGFLPGYRVTAALSAPGGDPRVFRVDGSEIALRCATAAQLKLRQGH
jgi:ferrous iron transport protein A